MTRLLALLVFLCVGSVAFASSLLGVWQAKIPAGAIELRVILIVEEKAGQLTAKLDSPDQGATGLPITSISLNGSQVAFSSTQLFMQFEGTMDPNGNKFSGSWKQGATTIPLIFNRLEKVPDYGKPQNPKPPFPYKIHEVTYPNRKGGFSLGATLTVPKTSGRHPVVILITGSGQQDRDETLLGHRPFWIIADYLTRRGIAVLRVDDRGVGKSGGNPLTSTTKDFATDVMAGISFLKQRYDIDPKRIGLVGHSEGGVVAPMVAAESKDVAFVVMLAGTGVTGEKIIMHQSALIQRVSGESEEKISANAKMQVQSFSIVKNEPDNAKAKALLDAEIDKFAKSDSSLKQTDITQAKAANQTILLPWFRYFLVYDPVPALRKVKVPVLAMNGELDLQVDPTQNLPPIAGALNAAGNKDFTIKRFPKLNHLFQTSETGLPIEYARISETFSPVALKYMGDWIVKRFIR